jgi:ADP-ribosylglycohydrolase
VSGLINERESHLETEHEQRLLRARESLEGLSVGDAFGELHGYRHVPLIKGTWYFTDDTNMALSIYEILRQYGEINQDALAVSFGAHYDPQRGYGPAMHMLLRQYRSGYRWFDIAKQVFNGSGSFGNGSAMRVAPVGAYFADDLEQAAKQARLSAVVTHAHSEGAAGAIAVSVMAAVACNLRGQEPPARPAFIDKVMPFVPESEVKEGLQRARDLAAGTSMRDAVGALGNGSQVTCQDTVPFVLWCSGEALYDYEEALWLTTSAGGDRDTTCAMVGGIVACYTGIESIPVVWRQRRELLPEWSVGKA